MKLRILALFIASIILVGCFDQYEPENNIHKPISSSSNRPVSLSKAQKLAIEREKTEQDRARIRRDIKMRGRLEKELRHHEIAIQRAESDRHYLNDARMNFEYQRSLRERIRLQEAIRAHRIAANRAEQSASRAHLARIRAEQEAAYAQEMNHLHNERQIAETRRLQENHARQIRNAERSLQAAQDANNANRIRAAEQALRNAENEAQNARRDRINAEQQYQQRLEHRARENRAREDRERVERQRQEEHNQNQARQAKAKQIAEDEKMARRMQAEEDARAREASRLEHDRKLRESEARALERSRARIEREAMAAQQSFPQPVIKAPVAPIAEGAAPAAPVVAPTAPAAPNPITPNVTEASLSTDAPSQLNTGN